MLTDLPKTRAEAAATGAKRYFNGAPCPRGHVGIRYTTNQSCVDCLLEKNGTAAKKAYKQRWYEENKERSLARQKEHYLATREQQLSRRQAYYIKNKDHLLAKCMEWRERNWQRVLERHSVYCRNRRAAKRASSGAHTRDDIAAILRAQKHRCGYCRTSLSAGYHVDHIMPLALGGANDRRNLQALCPTCNLRKNSKDPIVFAQENGRLL